MQELAQALEILNSTEKSHSDLEFLSIFLLCLEDFRTYTKPLSKILTMQLVRNLTAIQISRKSYLFHKCDFPTHWFILLDGELELFHTVRNEHKLIGRVFKGKQLGEREILRNKSYSFSCTPSRNSVVLCLDQKHFIALLGEQLDNRLIALRTFVHHYIPYLSSYSWNFKEKLGYSLVLTEYKRNETIVEKGFLDENLYFVYEGEVVVAVDVENKVKNIIKLGAGSSFAEECTLLNKPSFFHVLVSSERAIIASLRRGEIFYLPDETLDVMKRNLKDKIKSRTGLVGEGGGMNKSFNGNAASEFKSANRQAREKLMTYILRNRPCTPNRILNISRIRNKEFKEQLQGMRDCSPKRMKLSCGLWSNNSLTYRNKKSSLID